MLFRRAVQYIGLNCLCYSGVTPQAIKSLFDSETIEEVTERDALQTNHLLKLASLLLVRPDLSGHDIVLRYLKRYQPQLSAMEALIRSDIGLSGELKADESVGMESAVTEESGNNIAVTEEFGNNIAVAEESKGYDNDIPVIQSLAKESKKSKKVPMQGTARRRGRPAKKKQKMNGENDSDNEDNDDGNGVNEKGLDILEKLFCIDDD